MTRRKKANRLLALLCCMAMAMSMIPAAVYADVGGGVSITEDNFPDENFRAFVEQQYDSNPKDGELSDEELALVQTMDISGKEITDLKGIERFTSLTSLNCSGIQVASLDLSALTSLASLICEGCPLTELKVDSGTSTMNPAENGALYIQGWTKTDGVSVRAVPEQGYYLDGLSDGADQLNRDFNPIYPDGIQIQQLSQSGVYAVFSPYLMGMTYGQNVTKGTMINANLATIKPWSGQFRWRPSQCRVAGREIPISDSGDINIDTSSLPADRYTLLPQYQKQEMQNGQWVDVADEDAIGLEIPFTVEEAPYVGPSYYYLTVENGTGDGAYTYGSKPVIEADAPAEGKVFDKWVVTSGTGTIENEADSKTSFTMGFGSATVTATYKDEEKPAPQQYQLTVKKGSGSGTYAAGTQVDIKADKAAKGWVFDRWVLEEGKGDIADKDSSETTFTMAESDAVVKAVYEKAGTAPADKPDKPEKPDKNKDTDDSDAPKTGDDQMLFSWLAVMSAALAGVYLITRRRDSLEE